MKIFLSHSSSDKDIVGNVYKELGPGICHYDIATFDPCGFLPETIYSALNESTHFVLFASKTALASEWVRGELKTAFINWMRSRMATAMVFLLRGGQRSDIPDWLQNYVITEHPSPAHIACRILSEYDQWQERSFSLPPFYRHNELKTIEKALTVEAAKMPVCLLISGPDGMGRKDIINQLFSRQFRNVPSRKIFVHTENFDSDVDLFKSLKGTLGLTTARELANEVNSYSTGALEDRITELSNLIIQICQGSQTLLIEANDSILKDSGELNEWLRFLIRKIPAGGYPLVNIITRRRPNYLDSGVAEKTVICHLEPLPDDESELLFAWWTSTLCIQLPPHIAAIILEQVLGNPALIASAARLLKNIPDVSDMQFIKKHLFSDLERSASKLASNIAHDDLSRLILAFVVDCGQISVSDIYTTLMQVTGNGRETITETYRRLQSYGLLLSDTTSVRVPNYLSRTAKALGKISPTDANLKRCWMTLAESVEKITLDTETDITLLNEACVLKLKEGTNSILGIESLILPSQCLRTARRLYDNNEYLKAYKLCERAYRSRLALTDDGAIEALRFRGMSAARLNEEALLNETLNLFSEFAGNKRAQRISEFVRGFNYRLAGQFDQALTHMQRALELKGDEDIHILRELAYLYLTTGDASKAKIYITKAKGKARNNSYIAELQVLTELAFGKGYVIHNAATIQNLIDELESMDAANHKSYAYAYRSNIHYLVARGDIIEARAKFNINSSGAKATIGHQLLEAKLLTAEKKFQDAFNILVGLKKRVLTSKDSQRRSTLPLIIDLLIQTASGISISSGIAEFEQNRRYLPEALQRRARNELKEQAAFSRHQFTAGERKILEA